MSSRRNQDTPMKYRIRTGACLLAVGVVGVFLLTHAFSATERDHDALPTHTINISNNKQAILSQHLLQSQANLQLNQSASRDTPNPHYKQDSGQSIVCHTVGCGRLGNNLFEYVSVLGIARATNKMPVFTNPEVFQGVLKDPPRAPPNQQELLARCKKARKADDGSGGKYQRELINLLPGVDYEVRRCLQSWMYFDRIRPEVRQATVFTDQIVHNATNVISKLRRTFPDTALVGVHVRRGDFFEEKWVKQGFITASARYFQRAMMLFRERFPRVAFVVVGQDPEWSAQNLQPVNNDVVVLEPSSAEVDMQILSMTDHLVMSVGTYSWWAAFKLPDTALVVFLKEVAKKGSSLASWFSPDLVDYMLPHWIGITP